MLCRVLEDYSMGPLLVNNFVQMEIVYRRLKLQRKLDSVTAISIVINLYCEGTGGIYGVKKCLYPISALRSTLGLPGVPLASLVLRSHSSADSTHWHVYQICGPSVRLSHYFDTSVAASGGRHAGMKSCVHCFTVSAGLLTVWPTVFADMKISWSLPPCKTSHHALRSIAPRPEALDVEGHGVAHIAQSMRPRKHSITRYRSGPPSDKRAAQNRVVALRKLACSLNKS